MEFSFKNIAIVLATAVVGVIVVSSPLKNRIAVNYSKSSAAPLLGTDAGTRTLQVNNLNVAGTLGVGTTSPGGDLTVSKLDAGGSVDLETVNRDNTNAFSHARFIAQTGGSSAGDPVTIYDISGVSSFTVGVDNSDGDKFKIASVNSLGTVSDRLTIDTSGKVGIGTTGPNAKFQVTGGDAAISSQGNGLILKATDGANCYRVTVNNAGALSTALVACP